MKINWNNVILYNYTQNWNWMHFQIFLRRKWYIENFCEIWQSNQIWNNGCIESFNVGLNICYYKRTIIKWILSWKHEMQLNNCNRIIWNYIELKGKEINELWWILKALKKVLRVGLYMSLTDEWSFYFYRISTYSQVRNG